MITAPAVKIMSTEHLPGTVLVLIANTPQPDVSATDEKLTTSSVRIGRLIYTSALLLGKIQYEENA